MHKGEVAKGNPPRITTEPFFARVGKMWGKFKQKKKLSIELSNT